LQASLLARLDRLASVREVAQIGAALGRQFSRELISAVAPMPPEQLDDALAQLVTAELIYRRGTPPDIEYTFKHALVQDAAYSTLLRSRRQQLHARIAATLEDRFPDIVAAQPALLAHHCTEASLVEKAIPYWLTAGRQALARSAVAEAVALLRRGLALVPALPDTDWRRGTELDLQIALGQALVMNRSWGAPELVDVHSRARELASTLNRPRALLFALWGQATDRWVRADLKRARRLSAELRELGNATGDVSTQMLAYWASGITRFHLGEFTRGRIYQEKAVLLCDPTHRPSYSELVPHDARVLLRLHSSWSLACLGHLDQASFQREMALDEARRLSHPATLAVALGGAWTSRSFVRLDPGSLLHDADELLALATDHALGFYRALALIERGWCLAALGRAHEGIPILTAGSAVIVELGFMVWRPRYLTLLADACRMAGQWQVALDHLTAARRLAEETGERCFQAETVRLTGDVLAAIGDRAGAETSYREAIAIAQQQIAKLWELRAATSLAQLWRDQGRRAEARNLLAPVYGWFTKGSCTPVLQEAKALLDELA
jgi:predicted ATPase